MDAPRRESPQSPLVVSQTDNILTIRIIPQQPPSHYTGQKLAIEAQNQVSGI
jgi:hypothetical protein